MSIFEEKYNEQRFSYFIENGLVVIRDNRMNKEEKFREKKDVLTIIDNIKSEKAFYATEDAFSQRIRKYQDCLSLFDLLENNHENAK